MLRFSPFVFLIGIFSLVFTLSVDAQGFKPTPATFYDHCGRRDKQCFGDTDVCLDYRNCTYAVSISENRTHFELITLNNCAQRDDYKPRNFFLGVGLSTLDSQGNRECREPRFSDFKAFIFWDKVKCPRKTLAHELNWMWPNKINHKTNCEYDIAVNGTRPRELGFNLRSYLSSHIKLSSGDEQPYTFADRVDYIVKHDILYINRFAPDSEPADHVVNRIEVGPNNNNNGNLNNNNMGKPDTTNAQSQERNPSSGEKSASSIINNSLMSTLSLIVFFSVSLTIISV